MKNGKQQMDGGRSATARSVRSVSGCSLSVSGFVLCLLLLSAAPAFPWGCEGHQIIGLIAEKHLGAHARQKVQDLLASSSPPRSHHPWCHPISQSLLADASNWADEVRGDPRYQHTRQWHFIDIPLGVHGGGLRRFCPARKGCVTRAIKQQLAVLRRAPGASEQADQAVALLFVIHLVGDLHQPLHCADNHDEGGNCLPVTYFGMGPRPAENASYQPNLHAVWDHYIIRRLLGRQPGVARFAESLDRRLAAQIGEWQRGPIDIDAWAWETHRVAVQTAYGKLPVPVPSPAAEFPGCRAVSERMLGLHERLMQPYQDEAGPAAEEQLAKAGVRLAMVLNQLWP
jgi:hypothetical protein